MRRLALSKSIDIDALEKRQRAILDVVKKTELRSQAKICDAVEREYGIKLNPFTLGWDLSELGIVKRRKIYIVESSPHPVDEKLQYLLRERVRRVETLQSVVSVKTKTSGDAYGLLPRMKRLHWPEIAAVTGDADTLILWLRRKALPHLVARRLRQIIN